MHEKMVLAYDKVFYVTIIALCSCFIFVYGSYIDTAFYFNAHNDIRGANIDLE